jgi:hypothetical protein
MVRGHRALRCAACDLAFMQPGSERAYDYGESYEWLTQTQESAQDCLETFAHCGREAAQLATLTPGRALVDIGAGPRFLRSTRPAKDGVSLPSN